MAHITVFCGARGNSVYTQIAYHVGQVIAQQGHTIIYGGSKTGLMGAVAQGALDHHGVVVGIIPQSLATFVHEGHEIVHRDLTELVIVETLAHRKQRMINQADVLVILPGGLGTYDELFEVLTLNQLQITTKPVLLFSVENFFDHLLAQFEGMITAGFMTRQELANVTIVSSLDAFAKSVQIY